MSYFFKFNPLCHPPCRDYSSFMPRSTLCDLFHLSVVVHSPSRCCSLLYPNQVLCNRCRFFEYYIIHYAILFTIGYYATRYLIFGYYATLRYYVTCHTITRYYATCCFHIGYCQTRILYHGVLCNLSMILCNLSYYRPLLGGYYPLFSGTIVFGNLLFSYRVLSNHILYHGF